MNVYDVLDMMEDMMEKSMSLPFSKGRGVVDMEKLADLVADIRLNLPAEIKNSQLICQDRKDIIEEAKKEAESIIRNAEKQAKRLVNEQDIVKQAQTKANEMMSMANTRSRELRKATNEFMDKTLSSTEEALAKALSEVRESRLSIRRSSGARQMPNNTNHD